jgi:hypothetical protein
VNKSRNFSTNSEIVENIIRRLKYAYNLKSDSDLAEKLNYSSSGAISNWRKRDKVSWPRIDKYCENISRDFLTTGEGEPFIDVNKSTTHAQEPVGTDYSYKAMNELLKEERSRYGIEDIPDTELGRGLRGALDDAVSLVLKIRRLIDAHKSEDHHNPD